MKQLYKVGGEGPDPAALFQTTSTNPKQCRKDKSAMPRCRRAGVEPDSDRPALLPIRDNAKQVNERHQSPLRSEAYYQRRKGVASGLAESQ